MGKVLYRLPLKGKLYDNNDVDCIVDRDREDRNGLENYTFLADLKINDGVRFFSMKEVIFSSFVVGNHINTIGVFLLVFIHLMNSTIASSTLLVSSIGYIVIFAIVKVIKGRFDYSLLFRRQFIKSSLIVFLIILGFSTIFKTLTYDISLDSICLISLVLLFLNIVMNNYSSKVIGTNDIISLNAGIFAGVCLSSRLGDLLKVFSFINFTFIVFAFIPLTERSSSQPPTPFVMKCFSSFLLCISLSLLYKPIITALLVLLELLVIIIIPVIYYKMQSLKKVISGPWDEASPELW